LQGFFVFTFLIRMLMRVGLGYDVHRLVSGRELMLAGVQIPSEKGALGHSDADVLIHAVCDALLGAVALGDIGVYFPDDDPQYEGMAGLKLLALTGEILKGKGFMVYNVDAVILLEKPKIAPYINKMRTNIAKVLDVPDENISVKATTTEGLGFIGEGKGIAAQAIVTIKEISK
jgi:2-C-methyl-D-erythritol 2,4-cyclodiphosphate synthase